MADSCRLCLTADNSECLNIFSVTGNELRINEVISEHFKCDISKDDSLPNFVCHDCWTITESFHELYEKSKLAQEAFLNPIIKIEDDPINLCPESNDHDFEVVEAIKLEPILDEQDVLERDALELDIPEPNAQDCDSKSNDLDTANDKKVPNREINSKTKLERMSKKTYEFEFQKMFNEHKQRLNLSCEKCTAKFETLEDAQQHYPVAHNIAKGYIRCTDGKCKRRLRYPCDVVQHLKHHLQPENFKCDQCNKVYISRSYLLIHMKKHDNTNQPKFKRKFNILDGRTLKGRETNDNLYSRFIAENFDMTCDLCDTKFTLFTEARKHYRDVHNDKNGYIKCCNVKMKELWMVNEHINSHLNPDAFSCKICSKKFSSNTRLQAHLWRHNKQLNKDEFICDICDTGKSFSSKEAILRHMFVFHIDTEAKFECEICHQRFRLESLRRQHWHSRHNNRTVTCETCGKTFKDHTHYKIHAETHLDLSERSFQCRQCEHCGEWLRSKSGVYYHEQIHSNNVQKCEHCEMELPNRIALQAHVRKTHRARKHICKHCGRAFAMKSELTDHEESHTRHRTYHCQFCTKVFTARTSRVTHQKRTHPVELEEFRKMRKLSKDLPKST